MSTPESLQDVYIDELKDLWSANDQMLKVIKKITAKASDAALKDMLTKSQEGIASHTAILKELIAGQDEKVSKDHCKGMEGLVKEVHAHVLKADFGDDDARDAMIISQYQRMTHYGIAGYGCVAAFARRLELNDNADRLQECLDSTYEGDREMSRIAEGTVNADAV